MLGQIVVAKAGNRLKSLNVVIPPRNVLFGRSGWQGFELVVVDLVAEAVRDGVGIGPLHREAFLHIEMTRGSVLLVPVSEEDPFGHGRVQCDGVALGIGHGGWIGLILTHEDLEEGHDVFPVRERESLLGIGFVATEEFFKPRERGRSFRSVMGADVAVVEGVGESVLGHDVEIASIEIRIPL